MLSEVGQRYSVMWVETWGDEERELGGKWSGSGEMR